jgi:hypothetical protein
MRLFGSIFVLILAIGGNARATFNQDCKFAYRQGVVALMQNIVDFRENRISGSSLGFHVLQVDTGVKAIRATCYLTQDPNNLPCVNLYRNLYLNLRERTNSIALILGNQGKVEYSLLDLAKDHAILKVNDFRCDY